MGNRAALIKALANFADSLSDQLAARVCSLLEPIAGGEIAQPSIGPSASERNHPINSLGVTARPLFVSSKNAAFSGVSAPFREGHLTVDGRSKSSWTPFWQGTSLRPQQADVPEWPCFAGQNPAVLVRRCASKHIA